MSGLDAPTLKDPAAAPPGSVRRFRLRVLSGDERGTLHEAAGRCTLGSHERNDLRLADPLASRFHCEIESGERGARIKDLGSTNGTWVDGVSVGEAWLRDGSALRVGGTDLKYEEASGYARPALSTRTELHGLVGSSAAMREAFASLERVAQSDVTVLLEGETGTGKTQAAEAVHREGKRKAAPFVVVDCGAIPANLMESELFGHEKGAFTSADSRRVGAFEEAEGGTLFLDEIGELSPELQPKLLRVLESREYRRLGGSGARTADLRVLAGTNRDLRAEVNRGSFRADLYFRLAVVTVRLPALRARPGDVPLIARTLLDRLAVPEVSPLREPGFLASLSRHAWPGNVRELRNHLERCALYEDALAPAPPLQAPGEAARDDGPLRPFTEARDRALAAFERSYLERLIHEHGGKMQLAAAAAGVNRVYLYRLLVRHGLK